MIVNRSKLRIAVCALTHNPSLLSDYRNSMNARKWNRLRNDLNGYIHHRVCLHEVENSLAWALGFTMIKDDV